MNTYVLENWGDFLVVESQVELLSSWWEVQAQPQGLGLVRTMLCFMATVHMEAGGDRWGCRCFTQNCSISSMQTQGRILTLSQQRPRRGGAEPSVLVPGAGSGSSCGIYTLDQGGIFVQSVGEHQRHGAVPKIWLCNGERLC